MAEIRTHRAARRLPTRLRRKLMCGYGVSLCAPLAKKRHFARMLGWWFAGDGMLTLKGVDRG